MSTAAPISVTVGSARRWVERLGSPRLSLVLMIALFGVGVGVLGFQVDPRVPVTVVVTAMGANLVAALATHPAFRRATALTVFHLCLLAVAVLAALGQVSRLRGSVEVTEGEDFHRSRGDFEAGALHWDRLDDVTFRNEGFTIQYAPGLKRGATRNRVSWLEEGGRGEAEIGDQAPLVVDGYRFYTTFNKGFAPVFAWHPAGGGVPHEGILHFPSFPLNRDHQQGTLEVAGAGKLDAALIIEEELLDPAVAGEFRKPERHKVRVALAGATAELRPGDALETPGGRLVYMGLRTWMGYQVFADWTLPWLVAAACGAVGSLLAHYLGALRAPIAGEGTDGS